MRRETKKILFILTDGQTQTDNYDLDNAMRNATKEYVDRLIRAGVKVVGVGILNTCIADYVTDFIHMNDLATFPTIFYAKLSKLLL